MIGTYLADFEMTFGLDTDLELNPGVATFDVTREEENIILESMERAEAMRRETFDEIDIDDMLDSTLDDDDDCDDDDDDDDIA